MENSEQRKYSYGKKSLWKWILIYIAGGIVVYGLIYYFFIARSGGYDYNAPQYPQDYQY